jgi:hypothetical protein
MNVGLPGTGIGGLFYLLLAVLMPLHQLWRTARGRGGVQGWKMAAIQSTVALAILSALWGEGWLIKKGSEWVPTLHRLHGVLAHIGSRGRVLPDNSQLIAVASLLTLALLLLLVHGAGTFLGRISSRSARAE